MASFTQWLLDQSYATSQQSNLNDMRGGKYRIPDGEYPSVMAKYFRMCRRQRYYLSEHPRGAYRLFIDFDSSLPFAIPAPMNVVVSHCAALLRKMFGVEAGKCGAVLAVPSQRKSANPEFRAHLHFHDIYVSRQHLRMYLEALAPWLDQHVPFSESGVGWRSYIDVGCISLRLPYSFKKDHVGGFYRPIGRWCADDGRMTQVDPEDLDTLLQCLVRAPDNVSLCTPCAEILESRIVVESRYAELGQAVLVDEQIPPRLMQWLELVLPVEYSAASIVKLKRSTESGSFVLCSKDRYCHIASHGDADDADGPNCAGAPKRHGRFHRSNHVYFVCNRHGLFQRCTDDACKVKLQERGAEWRKACEAEGQPDAVSEDFIGRYGTPICHPAAFD